MAKATAQYTITDLFDILSIQFNKESLSIPTNNDGSGGVYNASTSVTASVWSNGVDDSVNWTFTVTPSSGLSGTASNSNKTYTLSNMTVDSATISFTAARSGFTSLTKVFNIYKIKQGPSGSNASIPMYKTPVSPDSGLFFDSTHFGYYDNGKWNTYIANTGDFALGDWSGGKGLQWNQVLGELNIRGKLTADDIQTGGNLTNLNVVGGTITIGSGSSVFKADTNGLYLGNETFGSAPFKVTPDGELTASKVNITGTITNGQSSSSITIGSGSSIFKADGNGIYLGDTTFANAPFRVSMDGSLVATNAQFTGSVTPSVTFTYLGTGSPQAITYPYLYIRKLGTVDAWDAGMYTNEAYKGECYCSWKAAQKTAYIVAGLTQENTTYTVGNSGISYGFYMLIGGGLAILENGVDQGVTGLTYNENTVLSIAYDSYTIRYYVDGKQVAYKNVGTGKSFVFQTAFKTPPGTGTTRLNYVKFGSGKINSTYIDATGLYIGTLTANQINSGILQSTNWSTNAGSQFNLDAGTITIGGSTVGNQKFKVAADGTLTCTNAIITGTINATAGSFSGNISSSATITGGNIATDTGLAGHYKRVLLSGTNNRIEFYNSTNNLVVSIGETTAGTQGGGTTNLYIDNPTVGADPGLTVKRGGGRGGMFQVAEGAGISNVAVVGVGASNGIYTWFVPSSGKTAGVSGAGCTGGYFTGNLNDSIEGYGIFSSGRVGVYGSGGPLGGQFSGDRGVMSNGNYYPFTGSHDTLLLKNEKPEVGDILCDSSIVYHSGVSDCMASTTISTSEKQKNIIGVFTRRDPFNQNLVSPGLQVRTPDADIPDYDLIEELYDVAAVNALGEGQINVCKDGGNIYAGDYICSSNREGKGMKQDDDLLHNYTVAKAREDCIWSDNEDDIRMIACTYHCG